MICVCIYFELTDIRVVDLHSDNFLTVDNVVSGVLDFEFTAFDWRVMELCVGLTKYVRGGFYCLCFVLHFDILCLGSHRRRTSEGIGEKLH
jgi:hypothetical protein